MAEGRVNRREMILQTLAQLLEDTPNQRITTAGLAKQVGVTEAALYRHFPSKRKMFDGLINFAEDAVFGRCPQILESEPDVRERLALLTRLLLVFAERNPGIVRVLNGSALNGEDDQLQARASQFFERFELQVRQVLKLGDIEQQQTPQGSYGQGAAFIMAQLEGRIQRFTRSGFRHKPTSDWDRIWPQVLEVVYEELEVA
ncbi:MAG: nucleoid occlusion factor SlmA [Halomonadaceae bacterium]|nr:MAG: nucleoid occlusion factor SlmA [Halomonadaceae bacterium]